MKARERLIELIPRLRRYARALVSEPVAADDLVQETLRRACAQPEESSWQGDLRTTAFSMMHEVYVRRMRPAGAAAEAETPAQDPPDVAERDFERAIATLPAEQRAVFLLVTLEEMRYEDVARTLGIPLGTVMSRLSRAREKLRLLLLGHARLKVVKTREPK